MYQNLQDFIYISKWYKKKINKKISHMINKNLQDFRENTGGYETECWTLWSSGDDSNSNINFVRHLLTARIRVESQIGRPPF